MRKVTVLAFLAAAIASASANVPAKISFTARLVNEESGDVLTGAHRVKFEFFDAATGGASVWFEGREFDLEDDGLLFAELGENKALDASVFDGKQLFLEVSLDDKVMEPRIALDSVPYAIRSHAATDSEKVGGKTAAELQSRVTGTCGAGNFMNGVNLDGSVNCAAGATGTGDITDVVAGSGLQGGGTSGSVTVSLLQSCTANQILKWTGTAWTCQADNAGTGDITDVVAGTGLMGGGTTGSVTLSLLTTCSANQVLKWNGAAWACGNDVDTDTNSGGDITSVTTAGTSGLTGGGTTGDVALSLLTSCSTGQMLKWNGTAWGCANDVDTNSGGDITDVVAGNGLAGGGATGALTLDVGAGSGIIVNANDVSLDYSITDGRYVNSTGDTMTGILDMNQNLVTNRGCPALYTRVGPGLCAETNDQVGYTFTGCANRCRASGTHMCSAADMRAVMASGVALGTTTLLDWIGDQDADDSAFYVNNAGTPENPDGVRATTTSSWCRCCASTE